MRDEKTISDLTLLFINMMTYQERILNISLFTENDNSLESVRAPFFCDGKLHYGSGWVSRKHAGFAPARQSLLGFRLRSPLHTVEEPCPLSLQTVFSIPSLSLVTSLICGCFCVRLWSQSVKTE